MEEKAGSFVIGADGLLTPNAADEAMAERHGLTKANQQSVENVLVDEGKGKKKSKGGE